MKRLDLGGTACYVDPYHSVSISLDGTNADDEVTPLVIGDYTRCPFPSKYFDEALGSCALEDGPEELHALAHELLRVMKPGGTVYLSSCDEPYPYHRSIFEDHGFKLLEEPALVDDPDMNPYPYYDYGYRWELPKE